MRKKIIFLSLAIVLSHFIYVKSSISAPVETDVAGVKLGMTPSQAEEALAKFNSGFKIERKFRGSAHQGAFEIESEVGADIESPGLLSGLEAKLKTDDCYELVWTYFSHLKDQDTNNEKVVAILRWKTYLSDFPQVAQLAKGVSDKVGAQPSFGGDLAKGNKHSRKCAMWYFNNKGNVLPPAGQSQQALWGNFVPWEKEMVVTSARIPRLDRMYSLAPGQDIKWFNPSSLMPHSINSNEPVTLQLVIESVYDNPLVAQGFTQILIDPVAYLKAFNEGKKILTDTADATRLKRQQDAAATSNRKEQF